MTTTNALNLGCNAFKFPGFINIDLDPKFQPDMILDCRYLDQNFAPNTIDFIHAGHFLEHVPYTDGQNIVKQCFKILKPFGSLLITVPDWTKCNDVPIAEAEKVIFGGGEHQALYDLGRLKEVLENGGFRVWSEIPLSRSPYLIYANKYEPVPDKWQTSVLALKTLL